MRLAIACVAGLALGGCGEAKALPAPGAKGPVVLTHWDQDPDHPSVVVADAIRSLDRGFRNLDLIQVRARVPLVQKGKLMGWLALESASGTMRSLDGQRAGLITLTGPIRIHGSLDGDPLVGKAATASLLARNGFAHFQDLDLVHGGIRTRMTDATLDQDMQWQTPVIPGQQTIRRGGPIPPELQAAYAALPRNYVPPDPSK